MGSKRTALLAGALALALVPAGCGGDEGTEADREEVERVVRTFAEAEGRQACDLLTFKALNRVYGGEPEVSAYESCVRSSKDFQGERVEIDDIEMRGETRAIVKASTGGEERRFRVTLRKQPKKWLIDQIVEE